MNIRLTGKRISISIIMVLTLCVLSSMVMAAEFSADMSQSMPSQKGSMTMKGKIYVKGILQRRDFSSPMGQSIVIMRPDKGVIWTLMPSAKSYMEQPTTKMDAKSIPSIESVMKKRTNFKKAGSARIAGYDCTKYTYTDTTRQMSGTVYISSKLQQQLKAETKTKMGNMSYSLSNIKEGNQPASLFNLPAGYKKMVMPPMGGGMPGMGKMNGGKGMPGMGHMGNGKMMPGMPPMKK